MFDGQTPLDKRVNGRLWLHGTARIGKNTGTDNILIVTDVEFASEAVLGFVLIPIRAMFDGNPMRRNI